MRFFRLLAVMSHDFPLSAPSCVAAPLDVPFRTMVLASLPCLPPRPGSTGRPRRLASLVLCFRGGEQFAFRSVFPCFSHPRAENRSPRTSMSRVGRASRCRRGPFSPPPFDLDGVAVTYDADLVFSGMTPSHLAETTSGSIAFCYYLESLSSSLVGLPKVWSYFAIFLEQS